MRHTLKTLMGQTILCQATVSKISRHKGDPDWKLNTIKLTQVIDLTQNMVLTNHQWVKRTYSLYGLQVGDVITFEGKVISYNKQKGQDFKVNICSIKQVKQP